MEPKLTELNRNEILMYLGHKGQEVDSGLEAQIRSCMDAVVKASDPRFVYRRLPIVNGEITEFPMEGKDIRKLLEPCREAVLMAATLGPRVEQLLMRNEVVNMADAVIMDACASAAIENVCDHFEFDLRDELSADGLFLTDRFSPGYGDLPLSLQGQMCEALNTMRRIGLTVSDRSLMIPRKSVTAIMGIADHEVAFRTRGCEVCSMFMTCTLRRDGRVCHTTY